tara:strand:- start:370 stop:837 length:468 start_codon:yes stop_codon:yes gene_type:complete
MTKVLLIEDDEHKVRDIAQLITENFPGLVIEAATNVREGFIRAKDTNAEVLILDMALPTFGKRTSSIGGLNQPQGGLEIIRLLHRIGKPIKVIILTQYPDIELNGEFYPLEKARGLLVGHYDCDIRGAILYKYQDEEWKKPFLKILSAIDANLDD